MDVLGSKQSKNPRYSIRAWSRDLGYKNPDTVAKVLSGKRNIGPELSARMSDYMRFDEEEQYYFDTLVNCQKAKSEIVKQKYQELIQRLNPEKSFSQLDVDQFNFIADWQHVAIKEMLSLNDFKYDTNWIARRLRGQLSSVKVELAIQRLLRLGMIVKDEAGRLALSNDLHMKIGEGKVSSEAIRLFHSQMIKKAYEAQQEQNLDQRETSASTVSIKKKDIPEMKRFMAKVHRDFCEKFSCDQADSVYQFNLQLFSLTKELSE